MSSENIWFPLYIRDYLADTTHLSTLEHGAYDLLLFSYYNNQSPLPDDDIRLARIAKLSVTDWQALRPAIACFFKIGDGAWRHKRADFEINRRKSAQVARQQGAKRTNEMRGKKQSPSRSPSRSPLRSMVAIPQSQSESQSKVQIEKIPTSSGVPSAHTVFIKLWTDAFKEHHKYEYTFQGGKDAAAVKAILTSKRTPETIMDGIKKVWNQSFRMSRYLQEQSVTIAGFAGEINKFRDALSRIENGQYDNTQFNGKPKSKSWAESEVDALVRDVERTST